MLTRQEESLLAKGLNFCPKPPHVDRGSVIEDNKAFSRKMRLKSHFYKAEPLYDNSSTPSDADSTNTPVPYTNAPSTDSQECTSEGHKYPKFKLKSTWQPPKQSVALETFLHNVESDVASSASSTKAHDNLSKQEKTGPPVPETQYRHCH